MMRNDNDIEWPIWDEEVDSSAVTLLNEEFEVRITPLPESLTGCQHTTTNPCLSVFLLSFYR